MSLVPGVNLRFELADISLAQPRRALLIGGIGTGGTAPANMPTKLLSSDDAAAFFGADQAADAAKRFFAVGLQTVYELWGFGVSTASWTANTWALTVAGTATRADTLYIRVGNWVIPVLVAEGDTSSAVATKIAAALNASAAPVSAAVDGVNSSEVDVTSTYVGTPSRRIPLSVNLYRDRGEPGVPGISVSVVNNANATGDPGSLTTTNLGNQPFDWYLHAFHTTAWLDALNGWIAGRWAQANNYAHALTVVRGTQSAAVTLAAARNDPHHSYVAGVDAPEYELETAINVLRAVEDEIQERGPGIGGINTKVSMAVPTVNVDAAVVLDAGAIPLRVTTAETRMVRVVGNRRKNAEGAQDLRLFDLAAILRTRELGERLVALLAEQLGKGLVQDGVALSPSVAAYTTSVLRLQGEVVALLVDAVKDGILDATEDSARQVLSSIEVLEVGGIRTGFSLVFDPRIVQNVAEIQALANLR